MRPPYRLDAASPMVAALTAAVALCGASCAEWVTYDDDFELKGSVTSTTLDDFSATRLAHLKLRGLISAFARVSEDGRQVLLDYGAMEASDEARYTLEQYMNVLATVNPSALESKNERYAYWINAYNAAVIIGVVSKFDGDRSYSVAAGGFFFDDPKYTFGGQEQMTLNHIEQGVLRGEWGHASVPRGGPLLDQLEKWHRELWGDEPIDSRFHAAVNCAALSCPNLLATAPYVYDPATLDEQLGVVVKAWLDSPKKGAGPDGISQLFDWYRSDFEASHGSVAEFIRTFRTEGLDGVDTSTFLNYDWALNITEM